MEITKIILENGQILSPGQETPALASVQLTHGVNATEELAAGGVCAAMAQIDLIVDGDSPIAYGDTFTLFRGQQQIGVFLAEKPQWQSSHRVRITAYDTVIRLEKDLTGWLEEVTPWPATLGELAQAVCQICGVSLDDTPFPNQDYPARPFRGSNITGRKILSWIAQAAGRFCTADAQGVLHFGWYAPVEDVSIGPKSGSSIDGILEQGNLTIVGISAALEGKDLTLEGTSHTQYDAGNLTLQGHFQHHYYQGSLKLADYETAPIEKVQICQDSQDVGVMYPDIGEANTYIITGNPLLTSENSEDLLPIAQTLYQQFKQIRYTPCTVTLDAGSGLKPGDIVSVTDGAGRTVTVYLMECSRTGFKETFRCTGSANRNSVSTVHDSSWEALTGKVLRLQTDVTGLRAENADAAGNSAALSLSVAAVESQVAAHVADLDSVKEQMTLLRQEKDNLELKIQTIEEEGVRQVVTTTGYRFSEEGLQISKSGMEMENRLDHSGMYVSRNGQQILKADNSGVTARDVTVGNYLVIGDHARFEDYGGGTACFYI